MCKEYGQRLGLRKDFCCTPTTTGVSLSLQQMKIFNISGSATQCTWTELLNLINPRPYDQVFTILGSLIGFVIPFVHVLMAERTIGHYRQALQAVKTGVRRSTHHNWHPRLTVTDFELALRTAIETELPATRIGGCYFHFTQALWRKIQEPRCQTAIGRVSISPFMHFLDYLTTQTQRKK